MATFAESEVIRYRQEVERYTSLIAQKEQELNNSNLTGLQRQSKLNAIQVLRNSLADAESGLAQAELLVQQQANPAPQPQPDQTVNQQVQAQQAQNPVTPPPQVLDQGRVVVPPTTTAPSNAEQPVTQQDDAAQENTDPPIKPLEQTQATNRYQTSSGPVADNNFVYDPDTGELLPADSVAAQEVNTTVATDPGVGADDDSGQTQNLDVRRISNPNTPNSSAVSATEGKITPQPNVLDRFHNSTWSASLYLLTPEQFQTYQNQNKKNVNGYNLLMQSGGAPINQYGPQGPAIQAQEGVADVGESPATTQSGLLNGYFQDGRNPFFPNDFFIDTITFENRLFGKATMAAHSVATLKFTVVEPANITLLDCLYKAVQEMSPKEANGAVNYASAVYLMVIRFYGYDQNGVIQKVGPANDQTGLTDPNAVVEKFIPFKIRYINWSVGSKLVTYEFDCAPIGQMIGAGTRRGSIPADIELSGATVKEMLAGDVTYSSAQAGTGNPGAATSTQDQSAAETNRLNRAAADSTTAAPPKATSAPGIKTLKQGLISAMNKEQQRLVREKIYEVADIYEIEFASGAESIRDATVTKPGKKTQKNFTPMAQAPTQNPSQSSPDKNAMDVTTRNFGVNAGMQIVQVIDLIIRNSNYITDQAAVVIDESTGQPIPNPKSNTKGLKWFNILMQATQLAYDNKRNDFAYRIKYIIVPYEPIDFDSLYFPPTQFRGVHKKYPWWFTGINTSVLDYTANFNKLYSLTVSGSTLDNSALAEQRKLQTSSMRDIAFIQYQTRSTESSQGAGTKANELAANAAEYLYNPSDNANAKIRILGDPAWIQQGSVTGSIDAKNFSYSPFGPDGTINFDTNDVLFEILWQRPEDYDLQTGLADPYSRTSKIFGDRQPIQSVVYRARTVTSEFKQGRFEQVIDGTLYNYPIPEGTNKATTAANPGDSSSQAGGTNAELPVRPSQQANDTNLRVGTNGVSGLNITSNSVLTNAARMSTSLTGSARSAPNATILNPGGLLGKFAATTPTFADTTLRAPAAQPVTSNGATVGVTEADRQEALRIQNESGDSDAITAEQVASNRALNASLSRLVGVGRLNNPNVDVTNAGTQLMSRDT